jgi:hypothetical protein
MRVCCACTTYISSIPLICRTSNGGREQHCSSAYLLKEYYSTGTHAAAAGPQAFYWVLFRLVVLPEVGNGGEHQDTGGAGRGGGR